MLLVVMLVKTIAGAVSAGAIAAAAAMVLERVRRCELIHAPLVRACVVPPVLSLCLRLRACARECRWIGWIRPPLLCFPLFFWTANGWRLHSSKRTSRHLKIKNPAYRR